MFVGFRNYADGHGCFLPVFTVCIPPLLPVACTVHMMYVNGEKQYCHCTVLLLFCDLSCTGYLHQTRSLHHPIASQLILESFSALLSLVPVYPRNSDYPLSIPLARYLK